MAEIRQHILGQKIRTVIYSEVNDPEQQFYFNGFDTFDHGINVHMENGYWWHLCWKDDEYFEFGEGRYIHNVHLSASKIKEWDATGRWQDYLNLEIAGFNINYIDEAHLIPHSCRLEFKGGKTIILYIAPELNQDGSIPYPLDYRFDGEHYVFFDQNLLN